MDSINSTYRLLQSIQSVTIYYYYNSSAFEQHKITIEKFIPFGPLPWSS